METKIDTHPSNIIPDPWEFLPKVHGTYFSGKSYVEQVDNKGPDSLQLLSNKTHYGYGIHDREFC